MAESFQGFRNLGGLAFSNETIVAAMSSKT